MVSSLTSPYVTATRLAALNAGAPVRVAAALEAGISRGELRAAMAAGVITRVAHGVIAVTEDPHTAQTLLQRCQALAARRPWLVFCHDTAATLLHQPLLRARGDVIRAYGKHAARIGQLLIHEGHIPDEHIVELHGIRVTSPLRTALDLARELPLPAALIPLDAALRSSILTAATGCGLHDDLAVESESHQFEVRERADQVLQTLRHLHGARNARHALAVASPLAESPAESASRGHLLLAGIVPLQLQSRVLDGDGVERRLDFLLAPGLAGEVDGFVKYEGEDRRHAIREEKRRDLALQRAGVFAVHWSAEESFWKPQQLIHVVRHALVTYRASA